MKNNVYHFFSPPSNFCSYFNSILFSIYHNLSQICTTNTNTNTNLSARVYGILSVQLFFTAAGTYIFICWKRWRCIHLDLRPISHLFSLIVCILFGVYSPLTNIYVLNSLTGKASPLLWVPLAGVSWEWMPDECIINTSLDHEMIDSFIHSTHNVPKIFCTRAYIITATSVIWYNWLLFIFFRCSCPRSHGSELQ